MNDLQALREQVRKLSKTELLARTHDLVTRERKIQADFLVHLERIEAIGLHLEYGYGSLHDFMITELKFTEGSAQPADPSGQAHASNPRD